MLWTKELVELLLIKYQEHENLYNVRHPDYMDRIKRSDSLFKIYCELKVQNEKVTVEAIKTKIHSLRSQFIKEVRRISASKRSGIGVEDVYSPVLWCFEQMEFLKPYCITRKSTSNIFSNDESELNSNSADWMSNSMGLTDSMELLDKPTTSTKRKATSNLVNKLKDVKTLITQRIQQKTDYEWLGQQVVFDVNSIKNEEIRNEIVWKIQSCLHEAKLADIRARNPPDNSPISFSSTLFQNSDIESPRDILQESLQGVLDDEDFAL